MNDNINPLALILDKNFGNTPSPFVCSECKREVPIDLQVTQKGSDYCLYCAPILCEGCNDNALDLRDFIEYGYEARCDECLEDTGETHEL